MRRPVRLIAAFTLLAGVAALSSGCVRSSKADYARHLAASVEPSRIEPDDRWVALAGETPRADRN